MSSFASSLNTLWWGVTFKPQRFGALFSRVIVSRKYILLTSGEDAEQEEENDRVK
jgi:hypothetical protein